MKIALLSGASSIHTIRWANGLAEAGHEVHVISQQAQLEPMDSRVQVHCFPFRGVLGYFTMVPAVKKLLAKIKPDIVNAHYASGYGTTARLVGYHPYLLSVWGADVYEFPNKSFMHYWLVKKNIMAANAVASTSHCMAEQTKNIAPKVGDITITPFGVDMASYEKSTSVVGNLIIGTVKSLDEQYGIDTLLQAFSLLYIKLKSTNKIFAEKIQLRLVGDGPQAEQLKRLALELNISNKVTFVGRVPHKQVAHELAKLNIYVALSRWDAESFGVAIIEAGAARRPVVVSDAGGLPEVTLDGVSGIVVPRENPQAAADAMEKLLLNPKLALQMGEAGRKHVEMNYSWSKSVEIMIKEYERIISDFHIQQR